MLNYIIKTASIELNSLKNDEFVKVAGVVRKLYNWFKQLSNEDYRENVLKIRNESYAIKSYMDDLAKQLDKLQSAINDADVKDYEAALEEVKYLSKQLSDELGKLGDSASVIDFVPDKKEEASLPSSGQKNDIEILPEEKATEDKPVYGRTNIPFRNSKYSSMPINLSEKAKEKLIISLPESAKVLINDDVKKSNFFEIFTNSIVNGTITQIYPVKKTGRETQLYITVKTTPFSIPNVSVKFVGTVLLNEIGNKLSVMRVVGWNVDKIANRKDELKKLAQSGNIHEWARKILIQAFKEEMGREPVLNEIQIAQSTAWIETNYGRGWGKGKGWFERHKQLNIEPDSRAQTSNNWGAVQSTSSKPPQCSGDAFRYVDTSPQPDGTSRPYVICFKAYRTPVEGAKDLIRNLFKSRGKALSGAIREGSISGFSSGMYDTKYYEGFGKTREDRIANHVSAINRGLNTITKALNESTNFDVKENIDKKELAQNLKNMQHMNETPANDNEVQELLNYLFAQDSLDNIVKKALEKKLLNKSELLIKINGNSGLSKIKYAKAISEVLKEAIEADCEICGNKENIEVRCEVIGNKKTVLDAVLAVCDSVSEKFENRYGENIKASVKIAKGSEFDILSDKFLKSAEIKFHLDKIGK